MIGLEPLPFSLGWSNCKKCNLHHNRTNVVLGVGNPKAELLFIGPYPGPDEDKVSLPFVGKAGRVLDDVFAEPMVQLYRDEVFIDNLVACWPTKEEQGKIVTGKPGKEHKKACVWRIWEVIYRIDPILIVALGDIPLKMLAGTTANITASRGDTYMTKIPGFYKHITYPVFATFNPAYVSRYYDPDSSSQRNRQKRKGTPYWLFRQDIVEAKELVAELKRSYREDKEEEEQW